MTYITSLERVGLRRGEQIGIRKGRVQIVEHQLKIKFGSNYTPVYRQQLDAAGRDQIFIDGQSAC